MTSKALRPLSTHAVAWLRETARGPVAAYKVNPGVRDRLYREGLIEIPSGKSLLNITDAGRAKLAELEAKCPSPHGCEYCRQFGCPRAEGVEITR